MRQQRPRGAALVMGLVALLLVGACSSSSPSKPAASQTATQSVTPTASGTASPNAAAEAAVRTSWVKFFDGATPAKQKVALLADGTQFASIIDAQAGSPLAKSVTATVSKVVLVNSSHAKVTYTVIVAGAPALTDQAGEAVRQGGTWKVSAASFCALLALENGGTTTGLPKACAPPAISPSSSSS